MHDHPNAMFKRLDSTVFERLAARSTTVKLAVGRVLAETHGTISHVYFPHSGVISNVVELIGGGAIETGMVGRDGVFGASHALDHGVSLNHVAVQVAVTASIVEAGHIEALANEHPKFRALIVAYEQFTNAQVQQTAACNAVHRAEARICRWLLRMHDLTEGELPLTHELLAQMIGVRRTSVTDVAGELADAGLIAYTRGRLKILDVKGLRARSCECHDEINLNYERLFP